MEHRLGRRMPVNIDVHLTCRPFAVGAGCLINASMSGAFVKTRLKPPECSRLVMGIELPQPWGSREHHELLACVVRHGADGLGLEWYDFGARPVGQLLRYAIGRQPAVTVSDESYAVSEQLARRKTRHRS